mmetsp:Transcript_31081/g.41098  ORF Transcript_31081/g.41098 Transcript_31081/m.41098 type:complete len:635 (-) Transcript_31081:188-2092(-)
MTLFQKYKIQILAISSIAVISCVTLYFFGKNTQKPTVKKIDDSLKTDSGERQKSDKPNTTQNKQAKNGSIEPKESSDSASPVDVPESPKETPKESTSEEEKEFEDLVKKAAKRFKGKQYDKAAELYTQMLEMLSKVPSKANEEITLYNNRSAMYEKMGEYDKCLDDCTKALFIEHDHEKVRIRRARVLKAKGDPLSAIREVATLLHLQRQKTTAARLKGQIVADPIPPPMFTELLDDYALKNVGPLLAANKARKGVLPSREVMMQSLLGFEMLAKTIEEAGLNDPEIYDAEIELARKAAVGSNSKVQLAEELQKRARAFIKELEFEKAFADLTEAHDKLEEAQELELYEHQTELLSWLGMFWIHCHEADRAEAAFEKCCQLEPLNAEHMAKKAGHMIDHQKNAEAKEVLDEAVELDEDCSDIYFVRCQLKIQNGDVEGAQEDLQKCVELRPKLVAAYQRLCLLSLQQGKLAEAQEIVERGLAACGEDNSQELLLAKGDLCLSTGDKEGAMEFIEKAIKSNPKRAQPLMSKATVMMQTATSIESVQQQMAEIIALIEQAVELEPKFNAAHMQLAQMKMGQAKTEEDRNQILEHFQKGIENSMDEQDILFAFKAKVFCEAFIDSARTLGITDFSLA